MICPSSFFSSFFGFLLFGLVSFRIAFGGVSLFFVCFLLAFACVYLCGFGVFCMFVVIFLYFLYVRTQFVSVRIQVLFRSLCVVRVVCGGCASIANVISELVRIHIVFSSYSLRIQFVLVF